MGRGNFQPLWTKPKKPRGLARMGGVFPSERSLGYRRAARGPGRFSNSLQTGNYIKTLFSQHSNHGGAF